MERSMVRTVKVCRSGASDLALVRVDVAEVLHHLERAALRAAMYMFVRTWC